MMPEDASSAALGESHSDFYSENGGLLDDEDESHEHVEIQGMEQVLYATASDVEDWTVESYANDSMQLARMRLSHALIHHHQALDNDNADAASLNYESVVSDYDDDWTVESTANDSVVMSRQRLSQPKPVFARVTRRRASMGDMITSTHVIAPQEEADVEASEEPAAPQVDRCRQRRRSSMSSAISSDSRSALTRHKSMPYPTKSSKDSNSNTIPLWPGETGKQQVAPLGTPAAA